jgi:hypothetical protein
MHLSRGSGEGLGKTLSILARRGLAPVKPTAKRKSRRFPTFEIPAGARIIPASRIARVIDKEGIP